MSYVIRELREMTGMTQKAFASAYEIPLSTLRKWEQGETAPAAYVTRLIAGTLPCLDKTKVRLNGENGRIYYYDPNKKTVADILGNTISVEENLEEINKDNLAIYLEDLFKDFYDIQSRFNRDCRYDKEEGILWTR